MTPNTARSDKEGALSTNDAVASIQSCRSRDEVLLALAHGIRGYLVEARLLAVQGNQLRGLVSLTGGEVETPEIKRKRLLVTELMIGGRAARDGIPYIGPLPPTDPFKELFPHADAATPVVVAPITLGSRAVCLLVGHPGGPATAQLRDDVLALTKASAMALAAILAKKRDEPQQDESEPAGVELQQDESKTAGVDPSPQPDPQPEPGAATPSASPEPGAEGGGPAATASDSSLGERRSSLRLPHLVEVTHTSDHNFFVGFMEDIGEGGLFVATYAELDIGEELRLQFRVPGLADSQTVHCRVRWSRNFNPQTPDVIPGVGVSFLDLSDAASQAIHRFLKQRAAIFYDD